ncbi:nucleolar and coiled-body phosphoprotein 1-like [Littorina saxatilis]|uniref:Uncharacterized protein n=1 Tax=Littorina saxatilis TaxID=31220 RepID=A0AAN9BFB8_9CAEN
MQKLPQQQRDFFYIPIALKAPLATFDTIDLGDEDVELVKTSPAQPSSPIHLSGQQTRAPQPLTLATKIGGAQSKGRGPASKAGGGDPHCQDQDHAGRQDQVTDGSKEPDKDLPKPDPQDDDADDDNTPTPTNQSPTRGVKLAVQPSAACAEGIVLGAAGESSSDPSGKDSEDQDADASAKPPPPPPRIGKIQGTWLQHQDSDSSSSSGSGSDAFTFRPIKGSVSASASATQDDYDDDDDTGHTPQTRRRLILRDKSHEYALNLYPDDLDPTQIASPSKRKAYQKRLQRLQVKTSPIVRPRSTTPINVVTLDEYILSSPEQSPASPYQEKLKISLPCEFASKPKSPRHARKQSVSKGDDSCFVFNEEILFSHTRSALVVDEVGQVPPSPRRVLIPPTLSPSSSPKLSRASRIDSEDSTQLVYCKGEKDAEDSGNPDNTQDDDSWAVFPEPELTVQVPQTGHTIKVQKAIEEHRIALSSDSEGEAEADEYLTVNIQPRVASKPANIEVTLSAASSSTPSPSTPDSDEAIREAASSQTVIPPVVQEVKVEEKAEPAPRPPPIPPRRRPPPPPPPPRRPPDVVPGDKGSEPMTSKCDLLVDIDSQ